MAAPGTIHFPDPGGAPSTRNHIYSINFRQQLCYFFLARATEGHGIPGSLGHSHHHQGPYCMYTVVGLGSTAKKEAEFSQWFLRTAWSCILEWALPCSYYGRGFCWQAFDSFLLRTFSHDCPGETGISPRFQNLFCFAVLS